MVDDRGHGVDVPVLIEAERTVIVLLFRHVANDNIINFIEGKY